MSYVYAFLGFAVLIILHEAGHFVAAKAVGMRVERFSLFFGPLLVSRRWGETEYGIGPIPLGGYVRITGMNPREELAQQAELSDLRAELDGVRSERKEVTNPERASELTASEQELMAAIAALRQELAVISERSYYNQPVWKRVVVILAGPAVNVILAFVIAWGLVLSNGQPVAINRVGAVERHAPATAHLRAGDRIVSVDGVRGSIDALHKAIGDHRCAGAQTDGCLATTPARVAVRRGGRLLHFEIRPRYSASQHAMLLGFFFDEGFRPVGAGKAASLAVDELWGVTKGTFSAIAHIVHPAPKQRLSSVVGAFTVTQESFAQDATQAFWVLALISLSLAIINLFPFLPLDGGHVFWALAEKVRGRRIPFSVMERASAMGFVLIIIVFVIGLSNDISTLSGSGFNVR
ncbi:MAG TPA: M50 family metallopeptidase [Solirubrobacteraceae bacterium]|jgi:regulator of sigma E protease